MGDTNIIQIQIPNCSSNYQISKDIYSFLNKQGNHIPIQQQHGVNKQKQSGGFTIPFFGNMFAKPDTTTNTDTTTPLVEEEKKEKEEETTKNSGEEKEEEKEKETIIIPPTNDSNNIYLQFQNKTHILDNIKGTKLYYLYLRNGECARWV
jgi:hypothetical protein